MCQCLHHCVFIERLLATCSPKKDEPAYITSKHIALTSSAAQHHLSASSATADMHPASDPAPCCQLTLVCDSPVSFDSLVRILVPLDTGTDDASDKDGCDPFQQQHMRALLTCEQLHSGDAEAVPFAAFPCSQTHIQVISHKVLTEYACSENLAACSIVRRAVGTCAKSASW